LSRAEKDSLLIVSLTLESQRKKQDRDDSAFGQVSLEQLGGFPSRFMKKLFIFL